MVCYWSGEDQFRTGRVVTFLTRLFVRGPCHCFCDWWRCERARKWVCQMQNNAQMIWQTAFALSCGRSCKWCNARSYTWTADFIISCIWTADFTMCMWWLRGSMAYNCGPRHRIELGDHTISTPLRNGSVNNYTAGTHYDLSRAFCDGGVEKVNFTDMQQKPEIKGFLHSMGTKWSHCQKRICQHNWTGNH